jgi:hypothetical protein
MSNTGPQTVQSQPSRSSFALPTLGLANHWSADSGINVADGQPVTLWGDSVGGCDLVVGSGVTAPTYQANLDGDLLPAVRFDGVLDQLQCLAGAIAFAGIGATIFGVARWPSTSGNKLKLWALCGPSGDEAGDGAMYWGADNPDGSRLRYNYGSTGSNYVPNPRVSTGPGGGSNVNINTPIPEWGFFMARFSTAFGAGYTTVRNGLIAASWTQGAARNMTWSQFYLGSGFTGGIAYPNQVECDVHEMGIYHTALNDSDVRNLMRYAGHKWLLPGLT